MSAHLRGEEGAVGPGAGARHQRPALVAYHKHKGLPADGHLRGTANTCMRSMRAEGITNVHAQHISCSSICLLSSRNSGRASVKKAQVATAIQTCKAACTGCDIGTACH